MSKRNFIYILSLQVLLFPYQVFANDFQQPKVYDRLERIERDLITLQKQFYRGDSSGHATQGEALSGSTSGRIESRMTALEEQLRSLNGKIEELEHHIKVVADKLQKTAEDNEFRFNEIEKNNSKEVAKESSTEEDEKPAKPIKKDDKPKSLGVIKVKPSKEASPLVAPVEEDEEEEDAPQIDYDKAFSLLKANKHDAAEKAFKHFIETHGEHKLAGNAYYWLGESYYTKKENEKAAVNFLKSYKKFPKGSKAPEALLKLSMSLAKLKKTKEACSSLNKLNTEFKKLSDPIKQKARDEAAKLGCK